LKQPTTAITAIVIVIAAASAATAQTSSLYLEQTPARYEGPIGPNGQVNNLSPAIARTSFSAVALPEPRKYALHDLVTIIVRESIENDSKAAIETGKDTKFNGEISDFPQLNLADLFNLNLKPNVSSATPKLGVKYTADFEGEGTQSRKDTFTSRITARIIDVKPNGTLVLEARKYMKNDSENLTLVLTGTCRKEDVTSDNTILSTQLYDLNLVKDTGGELRKATKKGVLTRVLEGLFNF